MGSLNISLGDITVSKPKTYTYKDFDIRMIKNNRGVSSNKDLEAIQQGLNNIFSWNQGQRIIVPEFGNNIYKFLYEPINSTILNNIKNEVRNLISRWEPRVIVNEVNIINVDQDDNFIHLEVSYSVPTLNVYDLTFKKLYGG